MHFKYELGDKVKDGVSSFVGIVTGRTDYLNGCRQYLLEGTNADGDPKGRWVDEAQLDLEEAGAFTPRAVYVEDASGAERTRVPGGPMSSPPGTSKH